MQWFYAHHGQQLGPITQADLDQLAKAGATRPETLVWREGQGSWQPFATVFLHSTNDTSGVGVVALSAGPIHCALVTPRKIDDQFAWLNGVSPKFLAALNELPGR